ncbi:protein commissureless 2 homolog [Macrosteles quadrilineatus]|uniref:protein commissureless 2 homolog n=1 Tax=Macrosteles quadrilineatus TaxID=74068 RepID=UPI0023E2E739|nr:protein commissureless 2 homolog [Macrosteles quadrilineatus]
MSEFLNITSVNEESSVVETTSNDEYDRLLADLVVWTISMIIVSCTCSVCFCICVSIHESSERQPRVLEVRRSETQAQVESGYNSESLPSYTVVAGLPTYEEAIERLRQEWPTFPKRLLVIR